MHFLTIRFIMGKSLKVYFSYEASVSSGNDNLFTVLKNRNRIDGGKWHIK